MGIISSAMLHSWEEMGCFDDDNSKELENLKQENEELKQENEKLKDEISNLNCTIEDLYEEK